MLKTQNNTKFIRVLACISDNYLRLTTAQCTHTIINNITPRLPLKVAMSLLLVFMDYTNGVRHRLLDYCITVLLSLDSFIFF
jgi:hypothetical protein